MHIIKFLLIFQILEHVEMAAVFIFKPFNVGLKLTVTIVQILSPILNKLFFLFQSKTNSAQRNAFFHDTSVGDAFDARKESDFTFPCPQNIQSLHLPLPRIHSLLQTLLESIPRLVILHKGALIRPGKVLHQLGTALAEGGAARDEVAAQVGVVGGAFEVVDQDALLAEAQLLVVEAVGANVGQAVEHSRPSLAHSLPEQIVILKSTPIDESLTYDIQGVRPTLGVVVRHGLELGLVAEGSGVDVAAFHLGVGGAIVVLGVGVGCGQDGRGQKEEEECWRKHE